MADTRFVYGVRCCWFGPVESVGTVQGLPCCPHCQSLLFEVPTHEAWWKMVDDFDATHPGYRKMVEWSVEEGRHFSIPAEVVVAYREATGIVVLLTP